MLLTINASGRVLDLFTVELPEWGVTEVAGELGLSKSKAHALLASLSTVGLLRRTNRGRYRLGWRVSCLNRVLSDTTEFQRQARPVLDVLCARFHETVQLAALEGDRVAYVDRVQNSNGSRTQEMPIGWTMPAHCTASGKVLLAGMAVDQLEAVIDDAGLQCRTPATITDLDRLQGHLLGVAQSGVAFDRGEAVPGICCVAAPVIGADGETIAAISICAPAARFAARRQIYEIAVKRAGEYVTRQVQQRAEINTR